mmetsp:Transcript_13656/g.18690  ORF Transcript_13656/g.18690 Transcript_13656/m.18690 type:complete len:342 (-) Transcript_13656:272-1297(-)
MMHHLFLIFQFQLVASLVMHVRAYADADPVSTSSFIHLKSTVETSRNKNYLYAIKKKESRNFDLNPQSNPVIFQDIEYFGGTVMTDTVRLYNIYYGDFNTTNGNDTMHLLDYFASNIGNTAWYKILSSYFQLESNGDKTLASHSANLKKSFLVNPSQKSTEITESDIQELLVELITSEDLPRDTNGVYNLIFDGKFQTPGWLTTTCSYHSAFYFPGSDDIIKYMVLNDPSTPSNQKGVICQAINPKDNLHNIPTANNNIGADSMASLFAHELAEVITNSVGSWHFAPDENGQVNEISDACAWSFGTYLKSSNIPNANIMVGDKPFLIQQLWQPGVGCTMGM